MKQSSKLCMTSFWNGLAFWRQPIGSNCWDCIWKSWGRMWGNSNEEDNIPRVLWSWSDALSQQYSKMSLIISPMTWTPSNQFEVAGWAIGTILKKTCFLSRRGWHLWIIKFAKIPSYLACCWDPHTFFLPTHFSTELKGLRKLPLLYIYQYWGRAL